MCVITNSNHIVVSVSFICGAQKIPESYHLYFPVDYVGVGEYFRPD